MEEILSWLSENAISLLAPLAGVVTAAVSLVLAALSNRKAKVMLDMEKTRLQAASLRSTYTTCPECHRKILLSEMKFYLPSGEQDQDLDGQAD